MKETQCFPLSYSLTKIHAQSLAVPGILIFMSNKNLHCFQGLVYHFIFNSEFISSEDIGDNERTPKTIGVRVL